MQATATPTAAQNAIANADAYLGDAVLPTYSELLAALRDCAEYAERFADLSEEPEGGTCCASIKAASDLLARHDNTMAGNFGGPAAKPSEPAPAAAQPVIEPAPAGAVHTFRMATYPRNAGKRLPSGCPFTSVLCVPYEERDSDIVFNRFTQDYSSRNARPYQLRKSGRMFGSLKSAVAALKKERGIGYQSAEAAERRMGC